MKKADAVIIGFGKGGKTLAGALAKDGRKVIMIEKSEKMYGGTCINVACIPTKSMVHNAEVSALKGGTYEEKAVRFTEAVQQKDLLTAKLRNKNYHKLADQENIEVITGTGSFEDAHHVSVNGETIETEMIFINTGARPFIPPIAGLKENRYAYTSEQLLDLKELPKRLVIIGGGYIGMEFASMYANFGSEVTIIQDGDVFLPREDSEIASAVHESLEKRGIRVICSAKVLSAEEKDGHACIRIETEKGKEEISGEAVLVATGRRPNTEGLHLEKAGVELTERGAVKANEHLQTSAENIYAMGDIVGGLQFTYISLDDYRIVKSAVLDDGTKTVADRGAVPYSVFLDPPFSRIGMSEDEAKAKGFNVKTVKLPASAIPKANVLQKPEGLLKAVIDADNGQILGAHLFCAESYEMINLIKIAMDAKLPYTVLRDSIYTHPTMSEAFNDLFNI
ncbi:MAG: FAD-dependent oxidoreductase [Solobacterium sp.]|nr:FAD-dependent oxidoreductase [Solobacterium sp.]